MTSRLIKIPSALQGNRLLIHKIPPAYSTDKLAPTTAVPLQQASGYYHSIIIVVLILSSMVAGLQEHRWSQYTSYSRTTWLTRVPICWETHITAFNSSGGTDISGAWPGIYVRGNRKSGEHISPLQWDNISHVELPITGCKNMNNGVYNCTSHNGTFISATLAVPHCD